MALPVRRDDTPMTTWNPWAELDEATRRLSSLVDRLWPRDTLAPLGGGPGWLRDAFTPLADLEETDDAYILEVELPGVDRKDVDVELTGRRLVVTGERTERERVGILRHRTRSVGRFRHEVLLPGDVDPEHVAAKLDRGVLTVTVPKAEAERRATRKVPVS